jgi:hypothetical protein
MTKKDKVENLIHGTRSTPHKCRRANDEGTTDIKDKVVSISIWRKRRGFGKGR